MFVRPYKAVLRFECRYASSSSFVAPTISTVFQSQTESTKSPPSNLQLTFPASPSSRLPTRRRWRKKSLETHSVPSWSNRIDQDEFSMSPFLTVSDDEIWSVLQTRNYEYSSEEIATALLRLPDMHSISLSHKLLFLERLKWTASSFGVDDVNKVLLSFRRLDIQEEQVLISFFRQACALILSFSNKQVVETYKAMRANELAPVVVLLLAVRTQRSTEKFSAQEAVDVLEAVSFLDIPYKESTITQFCIHIRSLLAELDDNKRMHLISVLKRFGVQQHKKALFKLASSLVSLLVKDSRSFTFSQCIQLFEYLASFGSNKVISSILLPRLNTEIRKMRHLLTVDEVSSLIVVLGQSRVYDPELIILMSAQILNIPVDVDVARTPRTVLVNDFLYRYMASLNVQNKVKVVGLYTDAMFRAEYFDIADVISTMQTVGGGTHKGIVSWLCHEDEQKIGNYSLQTIVKVLCALLSNHFTEPIVSLLLEKLAMHAGALTTDEIVSLLTAFSVAGVGFEQDVLATYTLTISKLRERAIQMADLSSSQFIRLLHSVAIEEAPIYDKDNQNNISLAFARNLCVQFRSTLDRCNSTQSLGILLNLLVLECKDKVLVETLVSRVAGLCQSDCTSDLYEQLLVCHAALALEHPAWKRLPRPSLTFSHSSEMTHGQITATLTSLNVSFQSRHHLMCGLVAEFALPSQQIVLEPVQAANFVGNLFGKGQWLVGSSKLKDRLLRKQGWSLRAIPMLYWASGTLRVRQKLIESALATSTNRQLFLDFGNKPRTISN